MLARVIGGVFGADGCSNVVGGLGGNFAVGIWRMSIVPIALIPALGELSPSGSAIRGNPLAGCGLWRCPWRSNMSSAGLATTLRRVPLSCPLALLTLALNELLGYWQGVVNGLVKLSQGMRLNDLHDAGKGQQVGSFSPGLAMIAEILEFLEGLWSSRFQMITQWECSKRSKSAGSLLVM